MEEMNQKIDYDYKEVEERNKVILGDLQETKNEIE